MTVDRIDIGLKTTLDQITKEKIYNKTLQSQLDFLCKKNLDFVAFINMPLENLNFYWTSKKSQNTDENLHFTQKAG